MYRKISSGQIEMNLKGIQYTDAICFEADKFSKEDYFIRGTINKESLRKFENQKVFDHIENNINNPNGMTFYFNKDNDDYFIGID